MEREEIKQIAVQTIQEEAEGILSIRDQITDAVADAANLMLNCKGHVLVTGSGTSHSLARRMAHLLSCCGTPSLCIDAGDSQHGLSGAVTNRDVLVALSKGGRTAEVIGLAEVAKSRGAALIAITEKPESELGELADVVLKITAPPDIDPYGMIATGSSLVNSAFCDALCVVMLKLRGYTLEEFGKTHPGGAVGKKLEELENTKD